MKRLIVLILPLAACGAVAAPASDGGGIDACVPETDDALCARLAACEGLPRTDRCGATRNVDCGACSAAGTACVHGTCKTPECTSLSFSGAAFPGIDVDGFQDDVVAAAPGGSSFVHIRSQASCGAPFTLSVTDEVPPGSGVFDTHEIPAGQLPADMVVFWGADCLSADGLTLVGTRTGNQAFEATTRSAIDQVDFGPASDAMFAGVNASIAGTNLTIGGPALGADGLELYYTLQSNDPTVAGIYRSTRPDTGAAFPAGARLPDGAQGFEFVSGLSADGLTMFLTGAFHTTILTRTSTSSADFRNPNDPQPAPTVAGWEVVPLAGCQTLVGISSPGGCANEDVFRFVPAP